MKERDKTEVWRAPTRRAFVQMLAAAAAVVHLRDHRDERPKPLWIGHY
jgi:hypothetical protein